MAARGLTDPRADISISSYIVHQSWPSRGAEGLHTLVLFIAFVAEHACGFRLQVNHLTSRIVGIPSYET